MNPNLTLLKSGLILAMSLGVGRLVLPPSTAPRPAAAVRAERPLKIGMNAPDFRLRDLDGAWITLKQFRDRSEMVLLVFFSADSPDQARALRDLNALNRKFGPHSGFHVFAVSAADPARAREFSRKNRLAYQTLLDTNGRAHAAYQIVSFPTFVLIGTNGALLVPPHVAP